MLQAVILGPWVEDCFVGFRVILFCEGLVGFCGLGVGVLLFQQWSLGFSVFRSLRMCGMYVRV